MIESKIYRTFILIWDIYFALSVYDMGSPVDVKMFVRFNTITNIICMTIPSILIDYIQCDKNLLFGINSRSRLIYFSNETTITLNYNIYLITCN